MKTIKMSSKRIFSILIVMIIIIIYIAEYLNLPSAKIATPVITTGLGCQRLFIGLNINIEDKKSKFYNTRIFNILFGISCFVFSLFYLATT